MTAYIIDSSPLLCEAITMVIQRIKPGIKIAAMHRLSALASAVAKGDEPELICMELDLPDTIGTSGVQLVRANYANVPLAIFSRDIQDYQAVSTNAGVTVYIDKTASVNQVLQKLRGLLIKSSVDVSSIDVPTKLTKRQKQLILLLDQGLSNREIAEKLDICEHTVKVHLWRLFRRCDVHSRTQALHFARTNGWLRI